MNCPKCGKETPDGALFCTGCGYRLENPSADTTSRENTDDETGFKQIISEADAPAETVPVADDTEQPEEVIGEEAVNGDIIEEEAVDKQAVNEDGSTAAGFEIDAQPPLPAYEAPGIAEVPVNEPAPASVNDNKVPGTGTGTDVPYFSVQPADGNTKKSKAAPDLPVKPLSTWSYIWREFVFLIPVVNIVVLFVFAFAEGINRNSRSFARAKLIYALIITLLLIAGVILFFLNLDTVLETLRGWLMTAAEWIGNLPR